MHFALILVGCFRVDMARAESDQGVVLLEELGQVEVFSTVVGLLVEIHCADTDLRAFEIGGDFDNEIVWTHIAKESDKTAFVEFNEFLCDADGFERFVFHPIFDKHVAWQSDDVFLHQGIPIYHEVHAIGREKVFELQSVDTGCVRFFNVEVILVVVASVNYSDPERFRISENAVVDTVDVKVLASREVSAGLNNCVDVF